MMQLIGERVRMYRRQKGWSQEQLGAMIGFSQSKISKIERGDWDSLSDLRLIANALGEYSGLKRPGCRVISTIGPCQ